MKSRILIIVAAALSVAALLFWRFTPRPGEIWIWAWERSEDLRFIDPAHVGVAYLASTVSVDSGGVRVRPRLQPLRVPPGTRMLAVARIEAPLIETRVLPDSAPLVAELLRVSGEPGITGLQIDFDAVASQRGWYREVVQGVRSRFPPNRKLSITALASWCLDDPWINNLPVDEAVPMLFRMGLDDRAVQARLSAGGDFTLDVCKRSIGVSTDERLWRPALCRDVYVFHPRPWTPEALRDTLKTIE